MRGRHRRVATVTLPARVGSCTSSGAARRSASKTRLMTACSEDLHAQYQHQFARRCRLRLSAEQLTEEMVTEDKSLITIYYGEDIQEEEAQKAADLFQKICPDADVNLLRGGQPVYYYIISVE